MNTKARTFLGGIVAMALVVLCAQNVRAEEITLCVKKSGDIAYAASEFHPCKSTHSLLTFNREGLKGDPGTPGEQGLKGDNGDRGEAGINGTNGLDGAVGSVGATGAPGEPSWDELRVQELETRMGVLEDRYQLGFVVSTDGTITDYRNGLVWKAYETGSKPNWYTAKSICDNLFFAEYDDWRLPSANELATIIDYSLSNPAADPIFHIGSDQFNANAWSVSKDQDSDWHWWVDFRDGVIRVVSNDGNGQARCVRGGY